MQERLLSWTRQHSLHVSRIRNVYLYYIYIYGAGTFNGFFRNFLEKEKGWSMGSYTNIPRWIQHSAAIFPEEVKALANSSNAYIVNAWNTIMNHYTNIHIYIYIYIWRLLICIWHRFRTLVGWLSCSLQTTAPNHCTMSQTWCVLVRHLYSARLG